MINNIIIHSSRGEYFSFDDVEYIEHHGVLGQKWGVRRYQNKDGSLTAAGRKHVGQNVSSNKVGSETKDAALQTAAISVAYISTLLAAVKLKEKLQTKQFNKDLDIMYENRDIKTLKEAPRLKKPMSASESMKIVNPGFPGYGCTENCMLCTTAMVMREKGYDVKAHKIDHALYNENIERLFGKGEKFNKIKARKPVDIVNKLNTEGDGAYGNLVVKWKLGGGHSVFWKNEGGKTHIYDGQSGKEYDVENPKTSKLLRSISNRDSRYLRLDNVEPNELVLAALTK